MRKIRVLSLFDGIGIARQALKELGYETVYYASEIDERAMQITQKNHPSTRQLEDVQALEAIHLLDHGDFDLVVGGSPCQDTSVSGKRKGLDGEQSRLLWEYVRLVKEISPRYFILENVASMSKDAKERITQALWGIEPVLIDAALVSAQRRSRLFWVGRSTSLCGRYTQVPIAQPQDQGIYVKDILDDDIEGMKIYNLLSSDEHLVSRFIERQQDTWKKDRPINVARIGKGKQDQRVYSTEGKGVCLNRYNHGFYMIADRDKVPQGEPRKIWTDEKGRLRIAGHREQKEGLGGYPGKTLKEYFRKLTPVECERMQSLPDGYTAGLPKIVRWGLLGNGFNCAVIKHILSTINLTGGGGGRL